MKKFERILLNLVNMGLSVFIGFAIGFVIAYYTKTSTIPWFALIGALAGLILWWSYRTKLLDLLLQNSIYQIVVNCVYMVGLFGVFMGVPVFNILPGVLFAYIIGINARIEQAAAVEFKQKMRRVNWRTQAILCTFLIASAAIALLDPYTGGNLQGMLGLSSEVTLGQIMLIIVIGGLGLMATQWLLARFFGRLAYSLRT